MVIIASVHSPRDYIKIRRQVVAFFNFLLFSFSKLLPSGLEPILYGFKGLSLWYVWIGKEKNYGVRPLVTNITFHRVLFIILTDNERIFPCEVRMA
jgi:hypothetical protein